MNRKALPKHVSGRSYRLLIALSILVLFASVISCIAFGCEAALGCLLWSTAAALLISLLTTSIGSIVEDFRHTEAREGNERAIKVREN